MSERGGVENAAGNRLLVRATNWLGDVVLSLPALRAIRACRPEAHIAVLCRPWVAGLYRLLPECDDVVLDERPEGVSRIQAAERLASALRQKAFDAAIILPTSFASAWPIFRAGIPERWGYRGELRGPLLTRSLPPSIWFGKHQVFRHLDLVAALGFGPVWPDVSWPVAESVLEEGSRLLAAKGVGGGFVAAHAASFENAAKRWHPERFSALFDRLSHERGLAAVLLGSQGERESNDLVAQKCRKAHVVNLAGETSLSQVVGVLANATLFVGNDSGISHLAGAVGTPTAVVFGPTDPDATRPWDGPRADGRLVRLAVVRKRPYCAPCRFQVCPIDHACMSEVTVDDVLREVDRLLIEAV